MKISFDSIPVKLLLKFQTKNEWLQHDSWIHGIDHMMRVFILQELICSHLEKQRETINRNAVRWAAATHDVGRLDDGTDLLHGQRSARWIKENLHDRMSADDLDTVAYIVHWHVPHDYEAPEMTKELAVLKDADGLDRVRLGDLDQSFLRTSVAPQLVDIATALYQESTMHNQMKSFESVLTAAINLGIVSDDLYNVSNRRAVHK